MTKDKIEKALHELENMDPKIVRAANEMLLDPNHDFSVFTNENLFQQNKTLINVKGIRRCKKITLTNQ